MPIYPSIANALAAVALLAAGMSAPAIAAEIIPGPVPARIVAVIDGDTLVARVRIWLDQELETRIRLAGVDAPELRGRCDGERALAGAARAFLVGLVGGADVTLRDVRYGKFARRVVARVGSAAVPDVSAALLEKGLAHAYDGGARAPWCPEAAPR